MTTLVFDALVQPQREVGEHLLNLVDSTPGQSLFCMGGSSNLGVKFAEQ